MDTLTQWMKNIASLYVTQPFDILGQHVKGYLRTGATKGQVISEINFGLLNFQKKCKDLFSKVRSF